MKWLEINQYNLRTGTAKAVARLVSFAEITCFFCLAKKNNKHYKNAGNWRDTNWLCYTSTLSQAHTSFV